MSELKDSQDATPVQGNLQAILRWSIQQQDAGGSGNDSKAHLDEKASSTTTWNELMVVTKDGASSEQEKWLHEALTGLSQQPSETDLLKAALAVLHAHAPSPTSSVDRLAGINNVLFISHCCFMCSGRVRKKRGRCWRHWNRHSILLRTWITLVVCRPVIMY